MPVQIADVDARLADLIAPAIRNLTTSLQRRCQVCQAQTRDDLTTDLALENLRIKGVSASDAEIHVVL